MIEQDSFDNDDDTMLIVMEVLVVMVMIMRAFKLKLIKKKPRITCNHLARKSVKMKPVKLKNVRQFQLISF